jgi:hypothetical protein
MGRQVTGLEGTITSWGSGASDWHSHLIATGTAPTNVTVNVEGPEMDTTSIGGPNSNRTFRNMLASWTVTGESLWPRANAYVGAQGLVTYSSGYTQHVRGWSLNMAWDALDVTEFNASGILWRSFRPSFRGKFTGSFRGLVDDATALTLVTPWTNTSAKAMTLKLSEDTPNTDNSFTIADAIITRAGIGMPIQAGGLDTLDYNFTVSGAMNCLSSSGDGSSTYGINVLPGSTTGVAVTMPTYDNGTNGVPNKTMLIKLADGSSDVSLSGTAFLTSVNITCDVDQPIRVSWTAQGTGVLTPAYA